MKSWIRLKAQQVNMSEAFYREDSVVSMPEVTPRGHHACGRMDIKLVLRIVFQTECDLGVWPLIVIPNDHPVHFLWLGPALPLWKLDLEELVVELGAVVVLVLHLDDHRACGAQGRGAVVRHDHLTGESSRRLFIGVIFITAKTLAEKQREIPAHISTV